MSRGVFTEIADLEVRLGLPPGFYENLIREDDWSFIIKLNALFEAACTQVLTTRLHAPELAEALAHLDLANTKAGKVQFLRALDAISKSQITILRTVAELRNDVVHNIKNVSFSFAQHLASMNADKAKVFVRTIGHGVVDVVTIGEKSTPRDEFVRQNPKLALWLTAAEVLACIHLEFEVAELRLRALALAEYQRLAAPPPPSLRQ
jgi:hypothetical protein